MKSVIISAILLFWVIIGVTANVIYTQNVAESLIAKAESVENGNEEKMFASIENEWEREKNILFCLYDHREIEDIEISVIGMKNALYSDNLSEFHIYKGEFLHSITRLKEISAFSIKNTL